MTLSANRPERKKRKKNYTNLIIFLLQRLAYKNRCVTEPAFLLINPPNEIMINKNYY